MQSRKSSYYYFGLFGCKVSDQLIIQIKSFIFYINFSDLAFHTKSIPKFVIVSHPKYGNLKKLNQDTNNQMKRSTYNIGRNFSDFTHEDIANNKILFVANDNLDLSYPNEILVDHVHYEVRALNVQSAFGVLVINILNQKLLQPRKQEFDNKTYEISHPYENYFNIIITKEHMIVISSFLALFFIGAVFLTLLKSCTKKIPPEQTNIKQMLSATNSQLNVTNKPNESIHGSEFGVESMIMPNRFSPRSTPSISEMEGNVIPMAPPTSPSQSTNCSILDVRSHSGTPRSIVKPSLTDILMKRASSRQDDSFESTNSSLFPLPPPSLYYGSEQSGTANLSMNTNTQVPMCKISPIFPNCCQEHQYSTFKMNLPSKTGIDLHSPYSVMGNIRGDNLYTTSSCNNPTHFYHCNNCISNEHAHFNSETSFIDEDHCHRHHLSCSDTTQTPTPTPKQHWV